MFFVRGSRRTRDPPADQARLVGEQLAERHVAVVHQHDRVAGRAPASGTRSTRRSKPSEKPTAGTSVPRNRPIMPS